MKILIVRPDGIGDLVVSLPVATQIRQQIPGAQIGFLVNSVAAPVLENHPDVDFVKTINLAAPLKERIQAFSKDVDVALFLKPFKELMWPAFLARTPIRIATGYRLTSILANRRIYLHRSNSTKHEAEYNLSLLEGLGITRTEFVHPQLAVTANELIAGQNYWQATHKARIIIHPGSLTARNWRPSQYLNLALNLVDKGYSVIFTGSEQERINFAQKTLIDKTNSSDITNLMGKVSIRELMAVIATGQTVVSGSTGPAHLAAALGVFVVSIFDPRRSALPIRWQPLGRGVLLRPDVPVCEKCIGVVCAYWDCLDRIKVSDVAAQIIQLSQYPRQTTKLRIINV